MDRPRERHGLKEADSRVGNPLTVFVWLAGVCVRSFLFSNRKPEAGRRSWPTQAGASRQHQGTRFSGLPTVLGVGLDLRLLPQG